MTNKPNPPLTWLRSFEAAGRLGSFKQAAASLHVSPSTISHQVRDLEELLGVPLFDRAFRSIQLTTEGQRLIAPLTTAFELIGSATESLPDNEDQLRIGGFPFLIHEILTPNIDALKQTLNVNALSLHVETNKSLLTHTDAKQRLDVIIRYASKHELAGLWSEKLFDITLVPIQSANKPTEENLEILLAEPVIKVLSPFDAWGMWRSAHQIPETEQTIALETDSYHAAVIAVAQGNGICLGIQPFIEPWLRQGKIKAIEKYQTRIPHTACIVAAQHNKDHPAVSKLAHWIRTYLT
ncbi:MAG: LysR family glycine cleavage system transcriptional activator [Candidatus Azotimanducaceae bacterium]|jgi:LysR family glycine cleavage system transcriptional activator